MSNRKAKAKKVNTLYLARGEPPQTATIHTDSSKMKEGPLQLFSKATIILNMAKKLDFSHLGLQNVHFPGLMQGSQRQPLLDQSATTLSVEKIAKEIFVFHVNVNMPETFEKKNKFRFNQNKLEMKLALGRNIGKLEPTT